MVKVPAPYLKNMLHDMSRQQTQPAVIQNTGNFLKFIYLPDHVIKS